MKKLVLLTALFLLLIPLHAGTPESHPKRGEMCGRHREDFTSADFLCLDEMPVRATPRQVDAIVKYIRELPFESEKLKAAVLCVRICPIASDDLERITSLFTFDDKKVEVLKAAFPNCPDKHRFHLAVESLTFASSREKVNKYIARF